MKKITQYSVNLIIGVSIIMIFLGGLNTFGRSVYLPNEAQSNDIFISKSNIIFSANAASDTFSISSSTNWIITTPQSWVTVNPSSGSNNAVITVSVSASTATVARETTISIVGSNSSVSVTKIIHIKQLAQTQTNSYLNVSRNNILLPSNNACSDTFKIISNVSWNVAVVASANSTTIPNWLTVTPVSGSNNMIINISAVPNPTNQIRTALVKVTSGTLSRTIEVKQPASAATLSYLNVSRNNILLPSNNACSDTFKIISNVSWNVAVVASANSTTIPNWLTVTPVSGSNNMIINISAVPNPTNQIRTALVKVTSGTLSRTIEVKQPASAATLSYLNVSRNNILLPSNNACSDTFKIISNVSWNVAVVASANSATIPNWLTVTPVSGSNNMIINISAVPNPTNQIRTALVKVTSGTLSRTIEVKQPASAATLSYLNVSRNNILLPSNNACSDTFNIISNVSWNVAVVASANSTTIPNWLTVTPVSGSNNMIINISAVPNPTNQIRTALVKVTSGTLSRTIEVKQPASTATLSYLNVSRNNIMLPSNNACSDTFNIISNVSWNVAVVASANSTTIPNWLTVTPVSGSNNMIINISAVPNPTNQIRTALVKVTSGTLSRTIEVKQPATINTNPFLNISASLFQFDATPSLSKTFNIVSNSGWIITTDVNWLTISPLNGSNNALISVTASANTSSQMRFAWIIVSVPGTLSKFIQVKQAGNSSYPIIQQLNQSSEMSDIVVNIYPNPAIDYVTLFSDNDFSDNDFVEVFSLDGVSILKQILNGNNIQIGIQNFKKGIYFMKINQNNKIAVKTISKN